MAGEFKPGDRVQVIDNTAMCAMTGATATVTERGLYRSLIGNTLLVSVKWDRNSLAGHQQDGGYEPEHFELIEPAPTSSPDTPEAGAAGERDALRADLAAALRQHFTDTVTGMAGKPFAQTGVTLNPEVFDGYAAAALPIIDRHTAKAINHAVMAQDTALRERDEARAEVERLCDPELKDMRLEDGSLNLTVCGTIMDRLAMAIVGTFKAGGAQNYMEMNLHDRDEPFQRYCVTVQKVGAKSPHDLRAAAESALSSEQSAHAETRKALEPFAKAAGIVEWSQRATGQSYRDEAPFQSGLAWQEKDGSARTITYADLRRARASLSPTQESTHADA